MVAKPAVEVTISELLGFVTKQRARRCGNAVRIDDVEAGLAAPAAGGGVEYGDLLGGDRL